ncbi:MAG: AAA family ATPase [Saprospiraceae bacterium]|nr:AAA family ATPase [Saprospiraceae bacterium]
MSETKEQQPAYISRVHLKGYKSIRDLEIDFKAGLNIIIGPNGSGKTNFLEFVSLINTYPIYQFTQEEFDGLIETNNSKLELKGQYGGDFQYQIIEKSFSNNKHILTRQIDFWNNKEGNPIVLFDETVGKHFIKNGGKVQVIQDIIYITFGNKIESILEKGIQGSVILTNIHGNGNQTVAINSTSDFDIFWLIGESLQGMKVLENDFISKIKIKNDELINYLKQFTPIRDLKIDDRSLVYNPINNGYELRNVNLLFLVNKKWLYWHQLSDGTKRLFYIFLKFLSKKNNNLFFIEEPELGIHPDQLYLLMDFLKEQSKEKQIIITTHSSEVLNILDKDELDRIIVTRYDDEKGTQMHHLSPHKIKKGQMYMDKVGYLSNFWVHSNLEEYEAEEYEVE